MLGMSRKGFWSKRATMRRKLACVCFRTFKCGLPVFSVVILQLGLLLS
ncbi:hypothetical protein NC652_009768 [Populus alba x Populus x berolinensis]|nr:hypothetical protein NC652_009768 [Populus alba x Populus x berolinensis]